MGAVLDILSWILLVAGGAFMVISAVGINRMPDVYTRLHAASVGETMGAGLLIAGMMLQSGISLVTMKLFFILAILFFTGPVSGHALARAALAAGVRPHVKDPDEAEKACGEDFFVKAVPHATVRDDVKQIKSGPGLTAAGRRPKAAK